MEDLRFYNRATKALMSSLKIETAYQNCLAAIQNELSADYLSLHLFDPGLGLVETVVDASLDHSGPVSKTTVLSAEARDLIHASIQNPDPGVRIEILDNLSQSEMGRQLGIDLDTPDAACMAMNLRMEKESLGFAVLTRAHGRRFTPAHARRFELLHDPLAMCAAHYHRYREMVRLKDTFADQAGFFRDELLNTVEKEIIGADQGLKGVMSDCRRVAGLNTPVLLMGETGVGKEVVATAIHRLSSRNKGPYIRVNCGAIPQSLMESELFGHEKGAFTGAVDTRQGYFERAHGGTLFLDEIGELPPEAQTRFLRILEDKTVAPLGSEKSLNLDIRIIAATNRDLDEMIRSGQFRQDLYFRLNVFPVRIPPLRERIKDIPALVRHFIRKKAGEMGLAELPRTGPGALDRLCGYGWPGNVRELENRVEREIILCTDGVLAFSEFINRREPPGILSLDKAMADYIQRALQITRGRVEGKDGAAELLDIHPRTLQSRMKKLGIPHGRNAGTLY